MAYLDLSERPGRASDGGHCADVEGAAASGLSTLEWQVVAVAQGDPLSTLAPPSRLAATLRLLFGIEPGKSRLADPRLEALRRAAVLAWHKGYALPPHEVQAFHDAGYSPEKLESLLAGISQRRAHLNGARRH
jgi:hypothetical protein